MAAKDSLNKVTGTGVKVMLGDPPKEYEFSLSTISDLADFEQHVLSGKLDMIGQIKGLSLEEKSSLIKEVISGGIDFDQSIAVIQNMFYFIHKSLSKKHPELTLENVGELIDQNNIEEISNILAKLGGETESKNPVEAKEKNQ